MKFPELNGSEYILEHLSKLGYAGQGFSGYVPLTYTEIYSYMKSTNTELTPSEVNLIKELSVAYVSQMADENPNALPPYIDDEMMKPFDNSESIKNAFAQFG